MELKEFVAESVKQIFEGVQEAQSSIDGEDAIVVPSVVPKSDADWHPSVVGYASKASKYLPLVQMVEFDVAVTVETQGEKKGGIGVVIGSVGIGGTKSSSDAASSVSRIRFGVPIALPIGKKNAS